MIGLIGAVRATESAGQAPVPDFSSNGVGWISINRDFAAVPGGPRPVSNDPAHPYVLNGIPGAQPNYRVADLNNPNLKPWVIERMKKDNAEVSPEDRLHAAFELHAGRRSRFHDL